MTFKKRQIKEIYLSNTNVENIFISEYMVAAPGEYVKVFLLSLMYANLGKELDNADIAKQLSLAEEDVLKAWTYWETLGAIKKEYGTPKDRFHYDVEFLSLKEKLYGSKTRRGKQTETEPAHPLTDQELKAMYRSVERTIGRLLGGKELTEILSWMTDYAATPEVILYAYSYCVKTRKKDNHKYVGMVVREWMEKQLTETSAIDAYLREVDQKHFLYKRVLKALGFTRNATEEEKRLMDIWFEEMEFSIDRVLEACGKTSGISNPNINYVNRILHNWHEGKDTTSASNGNGKKAISMASVQRYYDMIRKKAESEAEARRAQVYKTIPQIKEIDEGLRTLGMEISKLMISAGEGKRHKINQCKNQVEELSKQKNKLIAQNGLEEDYMETQYRCPLCRDSGTNDNGQRCDCFQKIQNEAELWQKSSKG